MSTIDLERLIVRQTYFISIEASKLKEAVLEELKAYRTSIDGVNA